MLDRVREEVAREDALLGIGEPMGHLPEVGPYAEKAETPKQIDQAALVDQHFVAKVSGLRHHAGLHCGVANPAPFANVLPFDEAWGSSVAVTALGPAARTLGHADALLLACVHRVAHHHDSPSLLWLWDVHLLANCLTASAWEALVRSAEDAGMRAVTYRGLELAREKFGTPVPADVVEQLTPLGPREPAARFIRGLRLFEIAVTDLVGMRSWRARLTFFRENLFPPLGHMRASYPGYPTYLLSLAYLHRTVRGARKWFRRPTGADLERQRP